MARGSAEHQRAREAVQMLVLPCDVDIAVAVIEVSISIAVTTSNIGRDGRSETSRPQVGERFLRDGTDCPQQKFEHMLQLLAREVSRDAGRRPLLYRR